MHFGFVLDSSDIDSLGTNLDLLATGIHSKHFVCLQEVLKTSSKHVFKSSSKHVFKSSSKHVFKTSWRPLQCNIFLSSDTFKIRLHDILKDGKLLRWRRTEGIFKTCLEDVFKTSWRPRNVCWVTKSAPTYITRTSCITDVFIINKFLNMFFLLHLCSDNS